MSNYFDSEKKRFKKYAAVYGSMFAVALLLIVIPMIIWAITQSDTVDNAWSYYIMPLALTFVLIALGFFFFMAYDYKRFSSVGVKAIFCTIGTILTVIIFLLSILFTYQSIDSNEVELDFGNSLKYAALSFGCVHAIATAIYFIIANVKDLNSKTTDVAVLVIPVASYALQVLILLFPVWVLSILGSLILLFIIAKILNAKYGWFKFIFEREKAGQEHKEPVNSEAIKKLQKSPISEKKNTGADNRSHDFALFNNAMERAINSVVANSSNYPDGRYVRVARKDVSSVTTKTFGIKIYGSVTYKAHHAGPARSANEYEQDIKNCFTRTQENLLNAAKRAAEGIQQKYQGFDNEWTIEVSLKPEVK